MTCPNWSMLIVESLKIICTGITWTHWISVAEPEPPLLGWSLSRFFKAASAPVISFWQAKKESLVVVRNLDLKAIYNGKCDPKKTYITNLLFSFKDLKMKKFSAWSRSRLFCLEPKRTQFGRSRSSGAAQKSGGSATLHWKSKRYFFC